MLHGDVTRLACDSAGGVRIATERSGSSTVQCVQITICERQLMLMDGAALRYRI